MAATIPIDPPSAITAGDTATWSRSFNDYLPADGWLLTYTLVSATAVFNIGASAITASADGMSFDVDVPAATTAGWAADRYKLVEVITHTSGERHTVGSTSLQVQPDLASATAGSDTRTHARKVLDSINAWLESKAPVAGSLEINGRKIAYFPLSDLLKLRDRYAAEVAREDAGIGKTRGTRILSVL